MNTHLVKKVCFAAVPLTIGCIVLWAVKPAPQNGSIFHTLAAVSVLELPETAAQLVAQAPAANKAAVMAEVLRAATALAKPEALAYTVSAICKSSPEIAGLTVETSVSLQPGDALAITKAAVAAAPNSVENIVAGACRVAPRSYIAVAQVAGAEVPEAREKILRAVISAMPSMTSYVERARSYAGDNSIASLLSKAQELSVNAVSETAAATIRSHQLALATTESTPPTTKRAASGEPAVADPPVLLAQAHTETMVFMPPPRVGPPLVPPPSNVVTLTTNFTPIVIPGSGRDYSQP